MGITFIDDSGKAVRIVLHESSAENEGGRISLDSPSNVLKSFEIDIVRFFGNPCIIKAEGWDSHIAIIPYFVGGGTGYGVYECCLETIIPNEIREYRASRERRSVIGKLERAIEDHYRK